MEHGGAPNGCQDDHRRNQLRSGFHASSVRWSTEVATLQMGRRGADTKRPAPIVIRRSPCWFRLLTGLLVPVAVDLLHGLAVLLHLKVPSLGSMTVPVDPVDLAVLLEHDLGM